MVGGGGGGGGAGGAGGGVWGLVCALMGIVLSKLGHSRHRPICRCGMIGLGRFDSPTFVILISIMSVVTTKLHL